MTFTLCQPKCNWISQGINRFILTIGYLGEKIQEHFGDSFRGKEIVYSNESPPMGTGGGLIKALPLLRDKKPTLVCNGDTFSPIPISEIKNSFEKYGKAIFVMKVLNGSLDI